MVRKLVIVVYLNEVIIWSFFVEGSFYFCDIVWDVDYLLKEGVLFSLYLGGLGV